MAFLYDDHRHSTSDKNQRNIAIALFVTLSFMLVEIFGGIISGSLALISDALHMLSDSVSLALALIAFIVSKKPAGSKNTYGFSRMQILAAFTNGVILLILAVIIITEAIERYFNPVEIKGEMMFYIAVIGLIINIVIFKVVHTGDHENLNIQAALFHIIGDILGSVVAIIASITIIYTGIFIVDPILSCLIATFLVASAIKIIKDSGHILLEGVPDNIDVFEIGKSLMDNIGGCINVHHIHIWMLTQEASLATLHVVLDLKVDHDEKLAEIKKYLNDNYNISHATIQIERKPYKYKEK